MSDAIFRYPPPSRGIRIGETLAQKYRVDRVIGRGGMGLVVAATHLHLREKVAIKVLLPGSPVTPEAFRRLLREGRAAARLRGEHVTRVLDAGVLDSGEPYFAMELLEGSDLRTVLRTRGHFPVETALRYMLDVCEAVAEAHSLGIVHRDLKPANLFEARRADGSVHVKVIDFGVSKMKSNEEGQSSLTAHGAIGTPAFMAPEQMRSAREVDARSDIWSLGAVLFALLTGDSPFSGDSVIEVYEKIRRGAPQLRRFVPNAPEAVEDIVSRCLQVDPQDRFASAGELAMAIAAALPEDARPSAERALRWSSTRPEPSSDASERPSDPDEEEANWPPRSGITLGEHSGQTPTASGDAPSWRAHELSLPTSPIASSPSQEPGHAPSQAPMSAAIRGGAPRRRWVVGGGLLLLLAGVPSAVLWNLRGSAAPPLSQAEDTSAPTAHAERPSREAIGAATPATHVFPARAAKQDVAPLRNPPVRPSSTAAPARSVHQIVPEMSPTPE